MSDQTHDEFYIGYVPIAPPGVSRRTRRFVFAYIVLSMIIATVCVAFFARTGDGTWHDASFQKRSGHLLFHPYPILFLDAPLPGTQSRTVLLVDFGKRGAQQRAAQLAPPAARAPFVYVEATGTFLERQGIAIFELAPDSDALVVSPNAPVAPQFSPADAAFIPGPRVSIRGEIVDPKCYLGAMKPGEGKTHKACAIRCISGGIPPALVSWDDSGKSTFYLLTNAQGDPANSLFLDLVGQPVEAVGQLGSIGDLHVLRVDSVRPL